MQSTITPAQVHYSSVLARGFEMRVVFISFVDLAFSFSKQ